MSNVLRDFVMVEESELDALEKKSEILDWLLQNRTVVRINAKTNEVKFKFTDSEFYVGDLGCVKMSLEEAINSAIIGGADKTKIPMVDAIYREMKGGE